MLPFNLSFSFDSRPYEFFSKLPPEINRLTKRSTDPLVGCYNLNNLRALNLAPSGSYFPPKNTVDESNVSNYFL